MCIYKLGHMIYGYITRRAHCFHDCIYNAHLTSVRFEHFVCRESYITIKPDIYIYIHIYLHNIYIYIYIYII